MNAPSEEIEIEIPEVLHFLVTESARYKVLYGGRGAGKTEGVALVLIALSMTKRLRIACFREFQKSIKESVHSTIKAAIIERGLESSFNISDIAITCKLTGSEFIFSGLRYNIDSIKSMARIDIAWVEEARNVSRTSWTKLGPTIRGRHESDPNGMGGPFGEGPEIWVTFNPELKDDETYKRFVLHPPSEYDVDGKRYSIIKKVNWQDNKFFPQGLRAEMEEDKAVSDDKYLEVWEGHVKQVLEGAVYAKELKKVLLDGRRGKVPYDPNRPVLTSWDLGHADKTAIWFIQRVNMEYNLIHYYENRLEKLPHYLKYMQDLGYVYGTCYQPHDAENETLAARSIAKQTRDAGYTVITVDRPAKKVLGINAARSIFDLCNFDEENTSDGWDCLANYAYKVNEDNGNFSREPDHDTPWSHGCFTADTEILTRDGLKAISTLPEIGEVLTQWGWKPYQNPRMTRANARLVELTFSDGFMVKCTPDHLFLTENGWKSAEYLTPGLLIQSGLMTQLNFSTIKFIGYTIQNIILHRTVRFIGMYGQKLSEQFRRNVTFIIKMKINTIINWIISNVFLGKNIYSLAGNYFEIEERLLNLQKVLEIKLLNGTLPKKEKFGILNMQPIKNLGKILKEKLFNVLSVGNLSRQQIEREEGVNIVRSNVDMCYLKKVERLSEIADVYCLTVPDYGQFCLANGVIVHNCDAFQTLALSVKTETAAKKKIPIGIDRPPIITGATGWMQ